MVGKEGAVVEWIGVLGFGVDDEGLHCGGKRRSHILAALLLSKRILRKTKKIKKLLCCVGFCSLCRW